MRSSKPSPDQTPEKPRPPQFQLPRWAWLLLWAILLGWTFLFQLPSMVSNVSTAPRIEIPYSVFLEQVRADNVAQVVFRESVVEGAFKTEVTWPQEGAPELATNAPLTSTNFRVTLLPVDDASLVQLLQEHNVAIAAEAVEPPTVLILLAQWAPLLLFLGFLIWSSRRAQNQMSGVFGFGKSKAQEYTVERPQVTFEDVAGQDAAKADLMEIVDFLSEPDKYIALGARIPRGVLLIGPPGTGKTLMARAVAGEAKVAFFSLTASEFVEMFVGVGASRVRDLFSRAKAVAPSIVFIDEIDAVGRHRGTGLGGGHDEREQTLNQLLSEMDGFEQNESVIVIAATNRPDVLDPALLRPGRFDRQVTLGLPDRTGRLDTLKIHTQGKPLASDVNLEALSRATIGFSGADLSNLANEAALAAARRSRKKIAMQDFYEALDRILLGTERPPLSNEQERQMVAYHEAGHALVSVLTPGADPVLKVTIVPRGHSLGVTAMLPEDDRHNYPRSYLMARMVVGLGGRSAEELVFDEMTTGAENDLRQVTQLARRMVAQFGMSDAIGPLNFGDEDRQPFLGYSLATGRNYSEETAARIDEEVKRMVEEAHQQARELLKASRDRLDRLAQALLEHEIVEQAQILEIAGVQRVPEPMLQGA